MMKLVIVLFFILSTSCKRNADVVTKQDFEGLKVTISSQVDSTVKRVVPDFIGKALLIKVQEMSDDIDVLKANEIITKQKIEEQDKKIIALTVSLSRQVDTITKLKNRALIPSPADFIIDGEKGILYIKRTVQ